MRTTTPGIDELVDALVGAFGSMTAAEQRLVAAAYGLLAEGAPVDPAVIAGAAGWRSGDVEVRFGSWPGGVYLDDDARLVGLWGMAVEAVSSHELRVDGKQPVRMWCALDPLFIVPLLAADAQVTSTCPTTGALIRLRVGSEGVEGLEPASAVVSFLIHDGPFDDDVRQTFCHFVHFFAAGGGRRVDRHTPRLVLAPGHRRGRDRTAPGGQGVPCCSQQLRAARPVLGDGARRGRPVRPGWG